MIAIKIFLIIFVLKLPSHFRLEGFSRANMKRWVQVDRVEVIMNIDKVGLGPLLNRMLGRTGPRFDKWGHSVWGLGLFQTCL